MNENARAVFPGRSAGRSVSGVVRCRPGIVREAEWASPVGTLSTTLAGYISDRLGSAAAFVCLAGIAAAGLALAWARVPETGPAERGNKGAGGRD